MYFGWHGLSSVGHILTLVSVVFFCLGVLDSVLQSKTHTPEYFHISRTNKRILFYLFKINYLKNTHMLPNNFKTLNSYEFYKL